MSQRLGAADRLLADAGATVSITTVAKCFGIHRTTAYELARHGALGVPVLRLGRALRVPTAELRRVLGLDQSAGKRGGDAA